MIDALQVFVRGFENQGRGETIDRYLTEIGFSVELKVDGDSDDLGGRIETNVVYEDLLEETDPGIILGELRERTDFNGLWLQIRQFHLSDQSEYGRGDVEEDDETNDEE